METERGIFVRDHIRENLLEIAKAARRESLAVMTRAYERMDMDLADEALDLFVISEEIRDFCELMEGM